MQIQWLEINRLKIRYKTNKMDSSYSKLTNNKPLLSIHQINYLKCLKIH